MNSCPDENTLLDFEQNQLTDEAAADLRKHIEGCPRCQKDLAPLLVPQRISRYRIVRLLGRGGMGEVFLGEEEAISRKVAIKILHSHFTNDPHVVARLRTEAQAVNLLRHPGVVSITEIGMEGGRAFLVMEYLEGVTLREHLRVADSTEALQLFRQIATTLSAVHERGIVHRDLKPENVLVVEDPESPCGKRAKVMDFGLAKVVSGRPVQPGEQPHEQAALQTGSQVILGTPLYMSPEQCRGASKVAWQTDVYALGVMLYEYLAGRPPFPPTSPGELIVAHMTEKPPALPALPAPLDGLASLALSMLTKDPEKRPTMSFVALELTERLSSLGIGEIQKSLGTWGKQIKRKRLLRMGLVSAGVLFILACSGLVAWRFGKGTSPIDLVAIPSGTIEMGSSPDEIRATLEWCQRVSSDQEDCTRELFEREQPLRQVTISSFFIERTEVTNQRFVTWINHLAATRKEIQIIDGWVVDSKRGERLLNLFPSYGPRFSLRQNGNQIEVLQGGELLPVIQVTWIGALHFCSDHGRRLPTEAEWEYAARGTRGSPFPWGAEEPHCEGVSFARQIGLRCAGALQDQTRLGPRAVGTSVQDQTPQGVLDLGGNVSEWVQDRFEDRYATCITQATCVDPVAPGSFGLTQTTPTARVYRGGNWAENEVALRAAGRARWLSSQGLRNVGFRCAADNPSLPR